MAQAYYRKWRPIDWDEVIGQEHVIRTLRNTVAHGNISHAYLFSGPRGTGKTSTARIIAKAANCLAADEAQRPCNECENCIEINEGHFLDLIEIDAASNTSVDDVRNLRDRINFSPTKGRVKIYIIDEVHMLSNAAFNALLKTLEEPPAHAIFILATTEVHKIPPTVLSRCQRHEFRRIPLNIIQVQLKHIADEEGITVETTALTEIARQATGSLRDAVSLLDQLASTGEDVTLAYTQQVLGTAANQSVFELIETLVNEDLGSSISILNNALDSGSDPRQYARQVVNVLRAVLMTKIGNSDQVEGTKEDTEKMKVIAGQLSQTKLLAAIRAFDKAAQYTRVSWQPGLRLELAAARSVQSEGETTSAQPKRKTSRQAPQKKKENLGARSRETREKKPVKVEKAGNAETPEKKEDKSAASADTPAKKNLEPAGPSAKADIGKINSQWKEIRDTAKSISPETAALLNSCRSVTMRRGRLVLGFASKVLCSKMENGQNVENAQAAIQRVTGAEVEIDCRVATKEVSLMPEDMDIETDGMVGEALSLGGKITKKETIDPEENGE
jgi:DNA polymerase-3 subunit gamma/tau